MSKEKAYEEILDNYSIDELEGVKTRKDKASFPDRYELVEKEIVKRKSGILSEPVKAKEIECALNKSARKTKENPRIKDMWAFTISSIFGFITLVLFYFMPDIKGNYGGWGVLVIYTCLGLNGYYGFKAFYPNKLPYSDF